MKTIDKKLTWGRCHCCGGEVPMIDGDNAHDDLPKRLAFGGECPGYAMDGICGAYEGWSKDRITSYARRNGAA